MASTAAPGERHESREEGAEEQAEGPAPGGPAAAAVTSAQDSQWDPSWGRGDFPRVHATGLSLLQPGAGPGVTVEQAQMGSPAVAEQFHSRAPHSGHPEPETPAQGDRDMGFQTLG